ncbi:MAG TPA: hypothetical protein VNY73_06510 [Bacteroidia bacterium]|nr:hypothetical protein [Bacteroidia bacterium]
MNKLIGIGDRSLLGTDLSLLKKCILFYDRIIVNSNDNLSLNEELEKTINEVKKELIRTNKLMEYSSILKLIAEGFITSHNQMNINLKREFTPEEKNYCDNLMKLWGDDWDNNLEMYTKNVTLRFDKSNNILMEDSEKLKKYYYSVQKAGDYRSRLFSYCSNIGSLNETYLPITQVIDWTNFSVTNQPKASIVNLIINNLPAVDMANNLDKIIEFKFDNDTISKKLGLRQWINKSSKGDFDIKELNEELEYQLNEYKMHIEYHKLKYNNKRLSILLTFPFEFIKNPMGTVSKLFDIREGKLDLVESERTAPGREFSFIHKANVLFQPSN